MLQLVENAPMTVADEVFASEDSLARLADELRLAHPDFHLGLLVDAGVELDAPVEVLVDELLAQYPVSAAAAA